MATLYRRDPATLSPMEAWLATIPEPQREAAIAEFLRSHTAYERERLGYAWQSLWARPNQLLPAGEAWSTVFVRAGRGYGKTRLGSEGVRKRVTAGQSRAVTIIGPTASDARDVMIESPDSGLLAVHPPELRPIYRPSVRTLEWPNGAIGHVRSAEEPDSIRGLNSDLVWGDEPASWKSGRASWDNAMFGNRLGDPKAILTGTPRPLDWLKEIEARPTTVVRTGSTYENMANLAAAFIALVLDRYEGTRLGQQELHALYLDDVEGALWRQALIEAGRIGLTAWDPADPWASLARALTPGMRLAQGLGLYVPDPRERRPWDTWVGVDPPGETAECGIIVGSAPTRARQGYDHCVILDDMSVEGPPEVWGPQVVAAIRKHGALGAVVEANQGGDMVRATIHAADPTVRVDKIRAEASKYDRAEPVSVQYVRGWVHHVGHLAKLETQQTTWVPTEGKSPDRLDAAVHLVTKILGMKPVKGGRASVGKASSYA